jgi:RNA 2',3'-cyclic 3'-phosphodiesterase
MRIFIAIKLPKEIKGHLREIQKQCKGINASFVKDFHLTLKFLGEVDEKTLEKVKEKLREIKFKSFKFKLSSVGCFPSEKYIRVLWVGIEPEDKVTELQKKIEESLGDFKFKKDFKFKPHLTLARVRFIEDKEAFVEKFKKIDVKSLDFEVDSFSLMKSTLTKQGAVYEELEKFEFV